MDLPEFIMQRVAERRLTRARVGDSGTSFGSAGNESGIMKNGLALFISLALCFGAASFGALFMPGDWYASLTKPSWNPPSWLFGPVWTTLYIMMAVSAWLVWKQGGVTERGKELGFFAIQLALNAAWTPLFFGMQWPAGAFVEILFLWVAILATLLQFWRVNRTAAVLLVPYLAWVSFAAFLNFTLWRLNP